MSSTAAIRRSAPTPVQWRAAGEAGSTSLEGFPATQIRLRGYDTGLAMGRLLDRFDAGWRQRLEVAGVRGRLRASVERRPQTSTLILTVEASPAGEAAPRKTAGEGPRRSS